MFSLSDDTTTSQFIAYFSFTSITNEEQGNLYKGGKKIAKTGKMMMIMIKNDDGKRKIFCLFVCLFECDSRKVKKFFFF